MANLRGLLSKFYRRMINNKASPLVEEGLLIGLSIIIFIILVSMINEILDWIYSATSSL